MLIEIFLLPAFYFIVADIDRLVVSSEPADASVSIQDNGRRLVRLPELVFPVQIDAHCGGGGTAESLSISVADTRRTIAGEALPMAGLFETSMTVSPRQIAPFALQAFCVTENDSGRSILIDSALVAQVSLRCARGDDASIVFDAEPLDIRLTCQPSDEPVAD